MKSIKNIRGLLHIRESFKTRQVKYGGYAALLTLAVIAGLILVNLMMGQFAPQIDLTESKLYSLTAQTMQVLETVNKPVRFYGLWKPGEERQEVITVINLYLSKNKNISLETIDPDRNPGFVARYDKEKKGISRGSLIVEGEKGFRVISPYEMYDFSQNQQGGSSVTGIAVEKKITSALLFAGTGNTPVVYEITGHGELPLAAVSMTDIIERENYSLKQLNLLVTPVPADASALILHGPRRDLTADETGKLLDYLANGGRLLALVDYNMGELGNLNDVLASYGIRADFGIVFETDPFYTSMDPRIEIPDLQDHDITKPLADKNRTPVVIPTAMAFSTLDTVRRSIEIKPLLVSSPRSFLRTDLDETSPARTASDIPGPLTLGMVVTDPSWVQGNEPQTRMVVIGGANLLPVYVQNGFEANRDLFMNSFAWLEERPETISVRSKSLFLLPLRLNLVQIVIFGVLFIFIIPMAFFVTGFVTWLKRRHL